MGNSLPRSLRTCGQACSPADVAIRTPHCSTSGAVLFLTFRAPVGFAERRYARSPSKAAAMATQITIKNVDPPIVRFFDSARLDLRGQLRRVTTVIAAIAWQVAAAWPRRGRNRPRG